MKVQIIRPEYVQQLPDHLVEGVLYISEEFSLTAHKCCCGCGEDVFNKLGPAKWQLTKVPNGTVSLHPSVGNWKYACRSHYFIRNNRVVDAGPMSAAGIELVKQRDLRDRDKYIAQLNAQADATEWSRLGWWGKVRAVLRKKWRLLRSFWAR